MKKCIFCRIIKGKIPCVKIWEDKNFIAILDINPIIEGMTLVIPKKHFSSYIFDMKDKEYCKIMLAAKKVAKLLDKGLKVKRTIMVMEGLGVNHAHIKLYPVYGLKKKFEVKTMTSKKIIKKYRGYIHTQLGPRKSIKELEKIAKKIRN
jgi:diadenosine tetraphosphate (Ap4A) HIT family hydrolase